MTASGPFFPQRTDDDGPTRAAREQQLRRAREVLFGRSCAIGSRDSCFVTPLPQPMP